MTSFSESTKPTSAPEAFDAYLCKLDSEGIAYEVQILGVFYGVWDHGPGWVHVKVDDLDCILPTTGILVNGSHVYPAVKVLG